MVNILNKDEAVIITVIPENKEEQELLKYVRDFEYKKKTNQSEYDYWTIKPKEKNKQMTLDDYADGFVPVTEDDEVPFVETSQGINPKGEKIVW